MFTNSRNSKPACTWLFQGLSASFQSPTCYLRRCREEPRFSETTKIHLAIAPNFQHTENLLGPGVKTWVDGESNPQCHFLARWPWPNGLTCLSFISLSVNGVTGTKVAMRGKWTTFWLLPTSWVSVTSINMAVISCLRCWGGVWTK
jgi:hypothetical protein